MTDRPGGLPPDTGTGGRGRELLPVLETPSIAAAPSTEAIEAGLTDEQAAAVTCAEGPLLIVAGAGTGKTTVITRRAAWLVASRRARPDEILALTFTDKAAREMEERVDVLVPYGYVDLQISTFHAFGFALLRDHALELGLNPNLVALSKPQQIIFLRERLFELPLDRYRPLGDPCAYLDALVSFIARAKDEDVSPERYLEFARALEAEARESPDDEELADRARRQMELARTYQAYEALMARAGYVDFGDQVYRVLRLLRAQPEILKAVQRRYRYVLVDEFQDTNHAQFELIRLLAAGHRNLTVVGDDDQAIYRFRGAAISNILQFDEHYPDARKVVLTRNFRSPQAILDASYRLIVHNNPDRLEVRSRIDKRLVSHRPEGPAPTHRAFDTVSDEADAVAARVAENVAAGRFAYGDHAVLVRANRDADPYLRSLNMRGIPFRFTGNQGLYSRPEVRLLIDFMRVTADPADDVSLYQLASSPVYQLDPMALAALCGLAARRHLALFDVMGSAVGKAAIQLGLFPDRLTDADAKVMAGLAPEARATVARIREDVPRYVALAAQRSPGQVLYQFLRASGLLERFSRGADPADDVAMQNIARFFDMVRSYEALDPKARLPQLVTHLDLLMEAGDNPAVVEADPDVDAVHVLTVHKAKGLEFPVVFVVGVNDGKFPSRRRAEALPLPLELTTHLVLSGDAHLQEERRLFYVAMTRAREALHVSSSRDAGGRRARRLSPFVLEALDAVRADATTFRASAAEAVARFAEPVTVAASGSAPIPDDAVLTLSHRQLDDYLTCPLKYKFVHVLRVPILAHHSVVYGRALHEAISVYNTGRQAGAAPSLEEVHDAFARAWLNEGFLSRAHEEQRFAQGRQVLAEWHQRQASDPRTPHLVEHDFSFSMGNDRVVGRFDRVDRWAGGSAIIDYKSTRVDAQDDADKRARDNLQLSVYALAWTDLAGALPDYVELQFLESGVCGRARKTARDLEETRRLIREAARGVRDRSYAPRPDFKTCQVCAFHEFCPAGVRP